MAVTYRGVRTPTGATVTACRDADPAPLVHIERHSPDGYEWGYHGSGPLDLAYSILCDFASPGLANAAYRQFAHRVIATLPHAEWTITARQISDFLVETAVGKGV